MNSYQVIGPACISFSGGRSSAYMLRHILDAHNGKLPQDVVVIFCNTGKEREETLRFVDACAENWSVPIVWLEYVDHDKPAQRWKRVAFDTASRDGQPFEEVIRRRKYLPNPVTRFCTADLKIKTAHRYLVSCGWNYWTTVLGFRADEPRRVARLSEPNRSRDDRIAPMAEVGVTKQIVTEWWAQQTFDLALPNVNGQTMHGNCDLCFLKGRDLLISLIREEPKRAIWWASMEKSIQSSGKFLGDGARFRKDRPSYASMLNNVDRQKDFFSDEPLADCFCGD